MTELELDLLNIIVYWRMVARQGNYASKDIYNLKAQGHLMGLSNAYNAAAKNLEDILTQETARMNQSNSHGSP